MTDRELLEAAAKAAGWDTNPWTWSERAEAFRYRVGGDWVEWNPRTDDGDAFRLMVKLDIVPRVINGKAFAWRDGVCDTQENVGADPLAAVRLAILKAAAEIGRSMK